MNDGGNTSVDNNLIATDYILNNEELTLRTIWEDIGGDTELNETTASVSMGDAGRTNIDDKGLCRRCIKDIEETTSWGVLTVAWEDVSSDTNKCLADTD